MHRGSAGDLDQRDIVETRRFAAELLDARGRLASGTPTSFAVGARTLSIEAATGFVRVQ